MPDRDDLGSAWKVPPGRYLAGRPPRLAIFSDSEHASSMELPVGKVS